MPKDTDADAMLARLYEVRRSRLRLLLDRHESMTEFAEAIGETLNYTSRLVKLSKSGRKNLGETKARKIELRLELPSGWLDQDNGKADPPPPKPWPFKFGRQIWEDLSVVEKRKAEAMLLTIINGIEAEREAQKGTG